MARKRWYFAALTVVAAVLIFSACGKVPQETSEKDYAGQAGEFPGEKEFAGNEEATPGEETSSKNEEQPTVSSVTVATPTVVPNSTPTVIIPEKIVDTSKEPYTYVELCEDVKLLAYAYPEIVSVSWEGKSADGREIPVILFGNPEAEQTVFIQAAIHGREHLTTLLVMEQLETYAKAYETGSYNGVAYKDIFSEVALLVVPMSNPDGVSVSQIGPGAIRSEELRALVESFYERDGAGADREYFYRRYKANARGVDLNRNFAYGWEEYGGTKVPAADKYKGETPGSEPETKLLMKLTKSRNTAVALSYHATGSVLYWDFGQTGELRERCLSFVETVHALTGYRIVYASSDKQDEAGYCEWAVGIEGIPEVTIEIGTVAAPLPISEFASVWERNKEVPVAVARQVMQGDTAVEE